ncbi:hypothetical protein [Nocardiopsis algeriensis]|uniref:Uncharacterized protein n=1 Tax=Nocardiopsis algeriensis TaxID=1478215 RepID=A0A841IU57_9ACTN|nr:hypothetical protein [Nocardiopsis algeriensis]MBB6120085.1 hypothetical protein [Nocardiopsis algeriensis]
MTDPESFSGALWAVLLITGIVLAFAVAIPADMALRRREDREQARNRYRNPHRGH